MKIWAVQRRHQYVPGRPMKALASETSANTEAASLVNIMLKDAGFGGNANNSNWQKKLKNLQKREGCGDADVYIDALELED